MKKLCTGIKTFDDGINLFCLLSIYHVHQYMYVYVYKWD